MKIGILTLPFNNNYGGLLQAYALQTYLKKRGHDVYSIQQPIPKKIKERIKQFLRIGRHTIDKNMLYFQHNYLQETVPVLTEIDFKELNIYKFDAIFVGSDQVWRTYYTKHNFARYFLDFLPNSNYKKIAFAASFGVDQWEGDSEMTKICTNLLKSFDGISVREKSGIDICKNNLNTIDVTNVFDPTLLMPAEFYRKLYSSTQPNKSGGIGVYYLDTNLQKEELVKKIEKNLQLSSFPIGRSTKKTLISTANYYPHVNQWLRDFDTADYIITDSFHGMIFATIFKKPFCVVGNKTRGLGRFTSFLSSVGLNDRLLDLDDRKNHDLLDVLKPIDYSYVDKLISENMSISENFLRKNKI